MSLGKVTVWQMTEEQRLAYIEKNPIVPSNKPKGTTFENVTEMQYEKSTKSRTNKKGKKITDSIDTEKLNKMFRTGNTLADIAKAFNISIYTVHNYIKEQRVKEPEKWPHRKK